jgi:hypothetical protein
MASVRQVQAAKQNVKKAQQVERWPRARARPRVHARRAPGGALLARLLPRNLRAWRAPAPSELGLCRSCATGPVSPALPVVVEPPPSRLTAG